MEERRALEETAREQEAQNYDENLAVKKERQEELKYQEFKLKAKRDFGIITQEEYEKIVEENKKAALEEGY